MSPHEAIGKAKKKQSPLCCEKAARNDLGDVPCADWLLLMPCPPARQGGLRTVAYQVRRSAHYQASFLAATSHHSGDWLFALPIASCGLKLDDEAVRFAVGLRLGLDLCVPHNCHCGSPVDARGLHSVVCMRAPGRSARHHALNDLVARSFASAGVPVTKEPTGLFRSEGNVQMASHWSLGRAASRYVGTSRVLLHDSLPAADCTD